MSPVPPKKPEKPFVPKLNVPIKYSQITFKINRKFVIVPKEKRAEYVKILDKMIQRVVKVINAHRTHTPVRLRAMTVLSDLIKTSYGMVRDEEIEQLERETAELEKEEEGVAEEEGSAE